MVQQTRQDETPAEYVTPKKRHRRRCDAISKDRNIKRMDTVGEQKSCRSCGGRGFKLVSSRRSMRVAEGTYVMRRKPCLDCLGLGWVQAMAGAGKERRS